MFGFASRKVLFLAVALSVAGLGVAADGIAVKPASFYEATFRARAVKGPTLEEHPQLEDMVPITASHYNNTQIRFAGFSWQFRESEGGKAVPLPRLSTAPTILYHSGWRDFVLRFWTPENATWFRISPGRGVEVVGISVREVEPGDTLNVNPRFDMSDEYVPGWHLANAAQLGKDRRGVSCVVAEEGSVVSDLFPVEPGTDVTVTLRGDPQRLEKRRSRMSATISFFESFADAGGGKALSGRASTVLRVGKDGCGSQVYTVPAGKRWARISAMGGVVYECSAKKGGM